MQERLIKVEESHYMEHFSHCEQTSHNTYEQTWILMKTFYKYMPYSTLLKFLNDPCLRVTPSHCQNDPFEFGFSSSNLGELNNESGSIELGTKLEEFAKLHGIISLTTSYENILMWSSYADSHRGAVIEVLIDDKKPHSLFINSTGPNLPPFKYQDFMFDKVSYKSIRGFKKVDNETDLFEMRRHYYFTKSDQWKFEEEYRFISPMIWINKILFNEDGFNKARKILGSYSSYVRCLNAEGAGEKIYELSSGGLVMLQYENIELISKLWNQSNINETMFFIRLNSGIPGSNDCHIGRVFLGCQANHDDFISELKNHHDELSIMSKYFNSINGELCDVFKGEIDKDKYKLLFKPVVDNIYK